MVWTLKTGILTEGGGRNMKSMSPHSEDLDILESKAIPMAEDWTVRVFTAMPRPRPSLLRLMSRRTFINLTSVKPGRLRSNSNLLTDHACCRNLMKSHIVVDRSLAMPRALNSAIALK